ncbi:MAG: S-layer homology domain-containing protein, partial [Oscillospiraceae bacterium]|nr:S-layer homology domain-containing protein [Oscillospiraceae bacterium]
EMATVNPGLVSTHKTHEKAAVYTLGNDGRDAELADIMEEIKALDNVIELSPEGLPDNPIDPDPEVWGYDDKYFYNKTGILKALQDLGIRPLSEFAEPNKNYLTVSRKTDDTLYLWAYNFVVEDEFKPRVVDFELNNDVNISVGKAGKPYTINTWTGEVAELAAYAIEDGRTRFDLTLEPGETTVIALDLNNPGDGLHAVSTNADKAILKNGSLSVYATESGAYTTLLSNGAEVVNEIQAPANISLHEWDLTVEDWTRGELASTTENRGKGYTTTEAYWTTQKTPINVGKTPLVPWKDIGVVGPAVSGIGTYTTAFELPADWSDVNGAYLDIESLSHNTAYVWINGERATGFDFVARAMDVSKLLQPGENIIKVDVSSTLRNRLIQMGYREMTAANTSYNRSSITFEPADYGMTGDVTLVTYTVAPIESYAMEDITITVSSGAGGTATGNGTFATGATVTLTAAPNTGYLFDGWYENNALVSSSPVYTFTVNVNRALEARFSPIAATPAPTPKGNYGGSQGKEVPLVTPTPLPTPLPTPSEAPGGEPNGEPGGEPDGEPNGEPSGEPTPTPTQPAQPSRPQSSMTDIALDYWATEFIDGLVARGIVDGYPMPGGSREYRPENDITRLEMVKLIVASLELDLIYDYDGSGAFADWGDVQEWGRPYMAAAIEAGIVLGSAEQGGLYLFPDDNIIREEMIAMSVRALGAEVPEGGECDAPDFDAVSEWAMDDVAFAVENEMINMRQGNVAPAANATRAESAMILYKLLEYLGM